MKSKRTAYIGIYSNTCFITRTCAVQYRNKEMENKRVCENQLTKSSDAEINTVKRFASEVQFEDRHTPLNSAQRNAQKIRISAMIICVVIITLACLITVFVFYFIQSTEIQSELKDLKAYLESWQEPPKVAFAASLRKGENITLGPYPQFHILVYENVFTNIGSGYNASTGIFTVPVKGVYRFFFTGFGWGDGIPCGVLFHLNNVYLLGSYDNNPGPGRGATNMITLEMEAGAIIYMGLSKDRLLHISPGNYNLFSGRLLFTL